MVNDEGEADGYAEEHKTEELFQPTIDNEQDDSTANNEQPSEKKQSRSTALRIARDSGIGHSLPKGYRNISNTKA